MTGSTICEAEPMSDASRSRSVSTTGGESDSSQFVLWIDGVGTYCVCLGERVAIGGPSLGHSEGSTADISLLANLSRRHATVIRSADNYLLEAHGPTRVTDRDVLDRAYLQDGDRIELGESVQLRFRLPSALSASARLEFVSSHRPTRSIDGIILMADTCLLGPGNENHVPCPNWPGSVLIYRKEGGFWCKSRLDLFAGHRHIPGTWRLTPGDVITGPELRFHWEAASFGGL